MALLTLNEWTKNGSSPNEVLQMLAKAAKGQPLNSMTGAGNLFSLQAYSGLDPSLISWYNSQTQGKTQAQIQDETTKKIQAEGDKVRADIASGALAPSGETWTEHNRIQAQNKKAESEYQQRLAAMSGAGAGGSAITQEQYQMKTGETPAQYTDRIADLRANVLAGDSNIDKLIDNTIETVISSGKQINPNLTAADLEGLDPSVFLAQAEASIAPEYREKFQVVKDGLTRELTNLGYDLTKNIEENSRITEKNLETGTEDLAGRGLAFSGQRETFNRETGEAKTRADEAARNLAFRSAQSFGSEAESLIGTSGFNGFNFPQIDGRSPFQFSSTPIVGSLTSERQYLKESMARELETQERQRKAFAERDLSFS